MTGIPTRIRALIRQKELTQREFARSTGLDESKLSKSLGGVRQLTHRELALIAETLEVPVRYLTHGDTSGMTHTEIDGPVRADARRRQILDAAARMIARRGFHAVRMTDIATECRTSRTAVHYYFPSRIALLNEALHWCAEQLFQRIDAKIQAVEGPEEQLRCLIDMQLPTEEQVHEEWSVWIQFWAEVCHRPELRDVHRGIYQRWHNMLTEAFELLAEAGRLTTDEPERAATRLAFIIDGATAHWLTGAADFDLDTLRAILITEAGLS